MTIDSPAGPTACEAHNMRVCEQREAGLRSQLAAALANAAALREQLGRVSNEVLRLTNVVAHMNMERAGLYGEDSYKMLREQHELACGRLAAAEALALTNGERADEWERRARNANDEWQSAMRLQGSAMSRASRAEAERAELQRRLDAAITPYDPATAHALAAVRAERDELRGRLVAGIVLVDGFAACDDSDDELAVIHRLTEWAHPAPTEPDGASGNRQGDDK